MSAKPYMRFFPSDWRGDQALRMCSIAARGLWIEMVCVMHGAEPYGSLLVNGQPLSEKQLAGLAGIAPRETASLLAELRQAGVFSEKDGIIYSRRMRRDAEKAERDKANGKGGGNPSLKGGVNPLDNPDDNGGLKAHLPLPISKEETKRASARYVFEGSVVKLNQRHFDNWTKAYPAVDLSAELTARDAYLGSPRASDSDRENWFISTAQHLANRNMEAKNRVVALKPEQPRGIPGIL